MKNAIKYIVVFIILLFIYQILFNMLKSEHSLSYVVMDKNKSYLVNENYIRNQDYELYYIDIADEDNHYIFTVNNKFNKVKNIVKSVKLFNNNNIGCMVIQLINDEYSEPMCIKNNVLNSYLNVKSELGMEKELEKYESTFNEKTDKIIGKYKINANIKNLEKDETLIVYNLKNLVIFKDDKVESVVFGTKDYYQNNYGILIGKYYVIPSILEKPDINSFIVHDVDKRITDNIKIETPISKSMYYNGVYNNELYITDKSNNKQYKLNPAKKTFDLVADEETEALVIKKGEEERVPILNITEKEVHFTEAKNTTYKNIKYDKLYPNEIFAYYQKDGKFYKVYEKFQDYPIFLFEAPNAKNVVVKKENIYFIEGTKLYKYNKYGLNVVIDNEEFEFNYKNRFDVYYK